MASLTEEKRLLTGIAQSDKAALAELYKLYYPRLERFLGRMLFDKDSVSDVIQEVFLVIWLNAGTFKGDSSPSTWILGIAYNKALKWSKYAHRYKTLDTEIETPGKPQHLMEQKDLHGSLGKLSLEQRAVIELTYYFGYSYHEISELLDCPVNTVKTRMYHARKKLHKLMQEDFL